MKVAKIVQPITVESSCSSPVCCPNGHLTPPSLPWWNEDEQEALDLLKSTTSRCFVSLMWSCRWLSSHQSTKNSLWYVLQPDASRQIISELLWVVGLLVEPGVRGLHGEEKRPASQEQSFKNPSMCVWGHSFRPDGAGLWSLSRSDWWTYCMSTNVPHAF